MRDGDDRGVRYVKHSNLKLLLPDSSAMLMKPMMSPLVSIPVQSLQLVEIHSLMMGKVVLCLTSDAFGSISSTR